MKRTSKRLLRPREYNRSDLWILVERSQRLVQLVEQRRTQRIERFWTIERDESNGRIRLAREYELVLLGLSRRHKSNSTEAEASP